MSSHHFSPTRLSQPRSKSTSHLCDIGPVRLLTSLSLSFLIYYACLVEPSWKTASPRLAHSKHWGLSSGALLAIGIDMVLVTTFCSRLRNCRCYRLTSCPRGLAVVPVCSTGLGGHREVRGLGRSTAMTAPAGQPGLWRPRELVGAAAQEDGGSGHPAQEKGPQRAGRQPLLTETLFAWFYKIRALLPPIV